MTKIYTATLILSLFLSSCGTPSTLSPIADLPNYRYTGKATILIAVEGSNNREVRHIEIGTKEEEGYEIYFHDKKVSKGFIVLHIPTPSSDVHIQEYSLTGMYGCSRGKDGYGEGYIKIPKIRNGKTYFLGTINTGMNTTYKEMPQELIQEAKEKYNFIMKKSTSKKEILFKSHIEL